MENDTRDGANELFTNEELWRHPDPKSTQMWQFFQYVNKEYKQDIHDYQQLNQWSCEDISDFWESVWHFTGIRASQKYTSVLDESQPMFPRPAFFPGAKLNFAENLLFPASEPDPQSLALKEATETSRKDLTWEQLRKRVQHCQKGMQALGIGVNDRVAGYVGNHASAIVFMLAATSLGAMWTAISPDSGVSMVLDRLAQIKPKMLVANTTQEYNGKRHEVLQKAREVAEQLPSLHSVVLLGHTACEDDCNSIALKGGKVYTERAFIELGDTQGADSQLRFEQLPPDHPVYILYSSGTTGKPKCIVHGAIGTLIQHKKEHAIQGDIRPGDRLFYFTTCTWMMWHWLVSGLASGATLILYDGSPMRYRSLDGFSQPDDLAMPRLIEELQINQFGTSAKYLSLLEQKQLRPMQAPQNINLTSLKAIYNTASPLAPSTFRYVYDVFPRTINLASITGGTDIVSLFGAPSPLVPVYAGEVQCAGLGMAIRAFDSESDKDTPIDVTEIGKPGDLVCVKPFPCQPVGFWPLGNDASGAERYRSSYFERFTNDSGKPVWHHGDYIAFNPKTSGLLMLGRSDGVLNPAGVRFGSAEIYNVLLKRFPGVVQDALCVGRRRADKGEMDETVCLFLRMEEGKGFDKRLRMDIKKAVKEELSARHVPTIVEECPDIPVTVNGKKVEGAVKQILSGSQVKTSASVANATSLDFFRDWNKRNSLSGG